MFSNKRKIAQQQRRKREKALKDFDSTPILEMIARWGGLIVAAPLVLPYQAFFRKKITPFWKFFWKTLHIGFYALILWVAGDTEFAKEVAEVSGEVYEKDPIVDYVIYWSILMIVITIISFFRKKKSKPIQDSEKSTVSVTAEVDEVKEGYFEATVIVPKGTSVPDSSLESIKQQVRESMEADGEEVIDVSIKILNAKKRSRTITQAVKDRVWNRDGGKCVQCGSNENLEFDHIIPFSKGGANTYRNIQLLCEPCNRSKSAKIG